MKLVQANTGVTEWLHYKFVKTNRCFRYGSSESFTEWLTEQIRSLLSLFNTHLS